MSTQVVLITGGLTGIGRAAAVVFAKKGAKAVVAGRRDEAGKALTEELRAFGAEAEFIKADVRKEDDVRDDEAETGFSAMGFSRNVESDARPRGRQLFRYVDQSAAIPNLTKEGCTHG